MANRIIVGCPLYGSVSIPWLLAFFDFQNQLMKVKNRGIRFTNMPYSDRAPTELVQAALQDSDWDYLIFLESDNIIPSGWLQKVEQYTEPIVALMYFGKVQEDQRPIPGFFRPDGNYDRLTFEQVQAMLANPGLHPVDIVGLGATAIRRDVFQNWNPDWLPWFKCIHEPMLFLGHDIRFCKLAKEQGYGVYIDSSMVAKHIGTWQSDDVTYKATYEWQQANGNIEPVPHTNWKEMAGLRPYNLNVPPL